MFGLSIEDECKCSSLRLFFVFFPGCVRPYMVQNSWVNLTETNRGSFPVGSVLQYSCDPGYLPNGPSILTCTTLGRWSSEPPQCIRSGGKRLFEFNLLSRHRLYSDCLAQSRNRLLKCFLFVTCQRVCHLPNPRMEATFATLRRAECLLTAL